MPKSVVPKSDVIQVIRAPLRPLRVGEREARASGPLRWYTGVSPWCFALWAGYPARKPLRVGSRASHQVNRADPGKPETVPPPSARSASEPSSAPGPPGAETLAKSAAFSGRPHPRPLRPLPAQLTPRIPTGLLRPSPTPGAPERIVPAITKEEGHSATSAEVQGPTHPLEPLTAAGCSVMVRGRSRPSCPPPPPAPRRPRRSPPGWPRRRSASPHRATCLGRAPRPPPSRGTGAPLVARSRGRP